MNPQGTKAQDKAPKAPGVKQQVVEKLKSSNNVLVTVSADPSVDQLSALIGLTLLLNKLDKHATAVFSGAIPSTIEFLQPEKTLEMDTNSLRDFIISLDKSKADKLRYKVEDDVVKIYITPYKTSITGDDLVFTQGDFNVDAIVALGVDNSDHLDRAVLENGRILHDAVVITLSCGEDGAPSELGSINWHEPTASSLSEMIVSISESFGPGLLDGQMATAFLTGIVERTERFSNARTTPKTMTMSAQLMASGANQQLIANELSVVPEAAPEPEPEPEPESVEETPIETYETPVEVYQPPEPEQSELEQSTAVGPEPSEAYVAEIALPEPDSQVGIGSTDAGLNFSLHNTPEPAVAEEEVTVEQPVEEIPVEPAPEPYSQIEHTMPIAEQEEGDDMALEEIKIDDQGRLRTKTEEDEENSATQAARQKVVQPLNAEPAGPKTDLNNYVFEPPTNNATFTASTAHESDEPQVMDTMAVPAQRTEPMLNHNLSEPPTQAEPPKVPAFEPDFPIEAPKQSLSDLEASVHSAHTLEYTTAARDSVMAAVNDPNAHPIRPEPRKDLNTSPLSDLLNRPMDPPKEQQDPPTVPPPLPHYMQTPPGQQGDVNLPAPQA